MSWDSWNKGSGKSTQQPLLLCKISGICTHLKFPYGSKVPLETTKQVVRCTTAKLRCMTALQIQIRCKIKFVKLTTIVLAEGICHYNLYNHWIETIISLLNYSASVLQGTIQLCHLDSGKWDLACVHSIMAVMSWGSRQKVEPNLWNVPSGVCPGAPQWAAWSSNTVCLQRVH